MSALDAGQLLQQLTESIERVDQALERAGQGDVRARVRLPPDAPPPAAQLGASANRLLERMLGERQRLRAMAARAFRAQEAERARIAGELQERTAQTLATVLFRLRSARQLCDAAARDAVLDELRDELVHATDDVRGYARALHPPALRELGIVAAIEAYARSLAAAGAPRIEIVADDVRGRLSAEAELALYRIVQEALANAVRHARAANVLTSIREGSNGVRALVVDDGVGFDLDDAERRLPCLGLVGMHDRALAVGGAVSLQSAPGQGTRLIVHVPSSAHADAGPTAPWPVILTPPGSASL